MTQTLIQTALILSLVLLGIGIGIYLRTPPRRRNIR